MLSGPIPSEDILQYAREAHVREGLADLFPKFTMHGVDCVLTELNMTAQRPLKELPAGVNILGHQQRTIARAPAAGTSKPLFGAVPAPCCGDELAMNQMPLVICSRPERATATSVPRRRP